MKNSDVKSKRVRSRSLNAKALLEAAQDSKTHRRPRKKNVEPWSSAHTATVDCAIEQSRSQIDHVQNNNKIRHLRAQRVGTSHQLSTVRKLLCQCFSQARIKLVDLT